MEDHTIDKSNRCIEMCRRVVTTESFISEAKEIWGDKYDYSKVVYKNKETRVTLTCPVHGDFKVYAREHLDGKGCPKCAKSEKFLNKLHDKFGDRFGLEKYIYESTTVPVTLICPEHGEFSRLPYAILGSDKGCPICGNATNIALHEANVKKKEENRIKRETQEKERLQNWYTERRQRRLYEEQIINLWKEDFDKSQRLYDRDKIPSPWQVYRYHIEEHIEILRHGAKWQLNEYNQYEISEDEAHTICPDLIGDNFYKFPNEAPNDFTVQYYNEYFRFNDYSFIENLEHRGCHLAVDGTDLIIGVEDYSKIQYTIENIIPARKLLCDNLTNLPTDFVGIDFETLYSQRVSACSIGLVKYKNCHIVDKFYSLIQPPKDYPGQSGPELTWIHGFTSDQFENEPTFDVLLPKIQSFIEDLPLVAHNASVERTCIEYCCEYYGLKTTIDTSNFLDTLTLSRRVEKQQGETIVGEGKHTLTAVCRRFGVPELEHHNALADAEMCGNLLVKFKEIMDNPNAEYKEKKVSNPHTSNEKYNPEDKIQRTDLENVEDNPFKNCVVVLTGFSAGISQDYGHQLKMMGAKVCTGVTKKTQWLICGANAGPSKLAKAKEQGVKIISEEEYLKMVEQ